MPKREEIDAVSRVAATLCKIQAKHGLTDNEMLAGVTVWYLEFAADKVKTAVIKALAAQAEVD